MIESLIFNLAVTLVPLILAIAVHEWAHVAMARWLGDRTGEEQGRLTLNPLAHIDPVWTVGLPAFLVVSSTLSAGATSIIPFFAAGRPAPYNPLRFTRKIGGERVTMRTGELLVAAAGPASNLVLAALTTGVLFVLVRTGNGFADPRSIAHLAFSFILLNVGLAAFNLIPVPPLDGSKVLMSLLPRPVAAKYESVASQLSWLLLLLLVFGGARFLLAPIQGAAMALVLRVVS